MTRDIWQRAIDTANDFDSGTISIGGGEPTLHPDFFEILQRCLWNFDYVWMATNGSRTKVMKRLANILDMEDYQNGDHEDYDGICMERDDQLCVELSTDYFHKPISDWVLYHWTRRSQQTPHSGYGLRDVTKYGNGPIAVGRAKRTSSGWKDGCVCSSVFVRPDGKIKLCGCKKSPIIGDVYYGIAEKWIDFIQKDEDYNNNYCYKKHHDD